MNAFVEAVAHEFGPECGVNEQLGLIVVECLTVIAQQALGKILYLDPEAL